MAVCAKPPFIPGGGAFSAANPPISTRSPGMRACWAVRLNRPCGRPTTGVAGAATGRCQCGAGECLQPDPRAGHPVRFPGDPGTGGVHWAMHLGKILSSACWRHRTADRAIENRLTSIWQHPHQFLQNALYVAADRPR